MEIRYGTWAVHGELTEQFDRALERRHVRRQRRRAHRRRDR
jgi:hypothetical protein